MWTVPPSSAAKEPCPPIGPAPWLSLTTPVDGDSIPGLTDFMDAVSTTFPGTRLSGTWFSEQTGELTLVVGLVTPTDADVQLVTSLAGGDGRLGSVPVVVQGVPLGLDSLSATQKAVDSIRSSANLEFTSTTRPDAGVVEVGVVGDQLARAHELLDSSFGPCDISVSVLQDADRYQAMVSRSDHPPYKAGKRVHTFIPYGGSGHNGQTTTCTAGFVFEKNGTGTQPLYGSYAGHCSQFDPGREVDDDQFNFTVVTKTLMIERRPGNRFVNVALRAFCGLVFVPIRRKGR